MKYLSNSEIMDLAEQIANEIQDLFVGQEKVFLYGVPRGGIPAVYAVKCFLPSEYQITDDLYQAQVIIDDIIDSGSTKNRYLAENPQALFYALVDKEKNPSNTWFIFSWEGTSESSIEDAYIRLKQFYNIADEQFETAKSQIQNLITNLGFSN